MTRETTLTQLISNLGDIIERQAAAYTSGPSKPTGRVRTTDKLAKQQTHPLEDQPETKPCPHCRRISNHSPENCFRNPMRLELADARKQLANLKRQLSSQRANATNGNNQLNPPTNRNQTGRECWNCGQEGHTRRECPQKNTGGSTQRPSKRAKQATVALAAQIGNQIGKQLAAALQNQ